MITVYRDKSGNANRLSHLHGQRSRTLFIGWSKIKKEKNAITIGFLSDLCLTSRRKAEHRYEFVYLSHLPTISATLQFHLPKTDFTF
jgi:hypothetical protein